MSCFLLTLSSSFYAKDMPSICHRNYVKYVMLNYLAAPKPQEVGRKAAAAEPEDGNGAAYSYVG